MQLKWNFDEEFLLVLGSSLQSADYRRTTAVSYQ